MTAANNPNSGRRQAVEAPSASRGAVATDLRILANLWAQRGLLFAVTLATAAIGLITAIADPGMREVDAALLYRFDREFLTEDPTYDGWRGEGIRIDLDTAIHTDLEILGSQRLVGMTVDRLAKNGVAPPPDSGFLETVKSYLRKPEPPPAPGDAAASALARSRAIAAMKQDLSIRRIQGTSVVDISFRSADGAYALLVMQTLLGLYLSERQALLDRGTTQALKQSLDEAQAALLAAEDAQAALKTERSLSEADARRSALQGERNALMKAAPADGTTDAAKAARVAAIDAELQQLDQDQQKLAGLGQVAILRREAYERVERLYWQEALTEAVHTRMGPPIVVLDAPEIMPAKVNLSASKSVVLSGLLGLLVAMVFVLLRDRIAQMRSKRQSAARRPASSQK